MIDYQKKKFNVVAYISAVAIVLALIVVLFIIYKYHVEGETTPPFIISKIVAVSTVMTENLELVDGVYNADLVQKNDIKIAIEKNPEYKKEAIIRKITINNVQIDQGELKGKVEVYRPIKDSTYKIDDKYKVVDQIEYDGAQETYVNEDTLQIANQGGIIDLSIIVKEIGKMQYNDNEAIKVDGTLLKRIGVENISFNVQFDLIIELESNVKLKTRVSLDLPAGDIIKNGIETLELNDLKTIFKRI